MDVDFSILAFQSAEILKYQSTGCLSKNVLNELKDVLAVFLKLYPHG